MSHKPEKENYRITILPHLRDSQILLYYLQAGVSQQPRRETMAARGGLSHLLDNFEDLRQPSSPSGLGPSVRITGVSDPRGGGGE